MAEVEIVKGEYVKAQSHLTLLIRALKSKKDEEISDVKEQMEVLIVGLTTKIDESLDNLPEHSRIASDDITQSVQMLSKKAQLKGYTDI